MAQSDALKRHEFQIPTILEDGHAITTKQDLALHLENPITSRQRFTDDNSWLSAPVSPPLPAYQAGTWKSISEKKATISPPAVKTDFSHDIGVVSSPFGLPSPILLSPHPRTASFNSKLSGLPPSLRSSISAKLSGSYLPRLVTVRATFTPTRNDELHITVGETLRLLEQFQDQWSLVQQTGRNDPKLGVVPTFCINAPPNTSYTKDLLPLPINSS
jgi:hypothetical protein